MPKWVKKVFCVCRFCGKEFLKYRSSVANGEGKYCSRPCMYGDRKKIQSPKRQGENVKCAECGKEFYVPASRIKEGRGRYCSKGCMASGFRKIRGKNHPSYRGENHSFRSKSGNRKALFIRNTEGEFKPEYRVIAERVLGRSLKPDEKVHHINMNPQDNRPCNLLICTNSYHTWLHQKYARRFAELHLGG